MCGIYGILIKETNINIIQFILDGLVQLQNRGYDSAGIYCTNQTNDHLFEKYASEDSLDALDRLNKMNLVNKNYTVGIGHNRWATHGAKTDINAHPHQSNNEEFTIVHNGIIENYQTLKDSLISKGYTFYSQTDTEVIANLLEENYKETLDTIPAIKNTIEMLSGTYGLVIIHKQQPSKLYCVRNGSPLLIGQNDDYCIITSEQSGFCKKVNTYITLNNDDVCEISVDAKNRIKIDYKIKTQSKKITLDNVELTPSPYEHWTLKEIYEQPQKILNSINLGGRILSNNLVKLGGLDRNKEKLQNIEHIILLGCGTSYYSCMYGKSFFKKLGDFNTIQLYDGADFDEHDIPAKGETLIIFVSQSGETKDLHRCINIAKNKNVITMGVINVVDSLIAREVDFGIYCNAGREMGVASTKAFTTQVICLCMSALWFSQDRNINKHIRTHIIKDLQNLSADFTKCLDVAYSSVDSAVNVLSKYNNLFILGKNNDEAIANEGALKIKEIAYIHSEGFSSSALKHGPFALLGPDMPLILLNNNVEYEPKVLNCYEEVASRKSPIIFITNNSNMQKENTIYIPYNESFSSLLSIIPLQLIAYKISVLRGINPDKPKNLAKVVTVE